MGHLVVGRDHAISTHALREEGDIEYKHDQKRGDISTHALREEGDVQDLYARGH